MRPIGGLLLLALDSYGQEDVSGRRIGGVGLDDDFIDFVEDGGGLDGASYDYADYTVYESNDDGRSRPSAEQLEALRLAAAASSDLVDPENYDYVGGPSNAYEYTDYDAEDYGEVITPGDYPVYALDSGDLAAESANTEFATASPENFPNALDFSQFADLIENEPDDPDAEEKAKKRRPGKGSAVETPTGTRPAAAGPAGPPAVKQLVGTHFDTTGFSCYSHHAIGSNTASTVAAFAGGSVRDCRDEGNGDFCMIEVRTQAGQIRQITTGCAQADYCAGIRNFGDTDNTAPFVPDPTRTDQCKPTTYSGGNTFMLNRRYRNQESVCRTCFYTNDGSTDGSNSHGLHLSGSDLFILDGAGSPAAIHSESITAWERDMWYTIASDLQTT